MLCMQWKTCKVYWTNNRTNRKSVGQVCMREGQGRDTRLDETEMTAAIEMGHERAPPFPPRANEAQNQSVGDQSV